MPRKRTHTRLTRRKVTKQSTERKRRAVMTEAEKKIASEKKRISRKRHRDLMSPEEVAKKKDILRQRARKSRQNQRINQLQEELKLIEWQRDTLNKGQGGKINVDDKFELETRRTQLNQEIRDIRAGCNNPSETKVPPKGKIKLASTHSQIQNAKRQARRRLQMTEAELNLERERNRINARIRRAVMTPEELEKVREKNRDHNRMRWQNQRIKRLQEELKIVDEKLEALIGHGDTKATDLNEKVELETRRSQLNLLIREISDAPQKRQYKRPGKRCEELREASGATESVKMDGAEGISDLDLELNSDSDMEDDTNVEASNLADLTYIVAECTVDPSEIFDEEDNEADQKMRPDETVQEWVKRVASTNRANNIQKIPSKGCTGENSEKVSKNPIEDPQKIRLIVMKAKAKLVKLQDVKNLGYDAHLERKKLNKKIAEQKKLLLKLMEQYPAEFNLRVANNQMQKRRQRKREIAAITRNNNLKPRQYLVQSTNGTRGHLRFQKLRFETKAQRIDRIAQKIKFIRVNATNVDETPEEVAARILKELEEAREKYKKRYQQAETCTSSTQQNSLAPNVDHGGPVGSFNTEKDLDEYLQWYKLKKYLETPEEKAERNAKLAAYAREKNKMEKGEYKLFLMLTTSPNPLISLENEVSAPEILNYWKKFKYPKYKSTSTRKPPDFLIEWRLKTYSFLYDKEEKESETEKNTRFDRQNEDLKKWLEVNGAELTEYLNKRRHKMSEYLKKRNKKVEKEMTEEEKDAKRRKLNEKFRQHYLKKKLAEGIAITPKGERPHANKYYKKNPEVVVTEPKVPKPRRERRIKYSGSKSKRSVGSAKLRKIVGTKSENRSYPISESESVSTSSDMPPPIQNPPTSNTASMHRVSSSENNSWPTLGLLNASSMEEDPGHDDDDQQDDGDDWVPVNSYLERSFEPPVNQSHQLQQFGGNQLLGVHNSNPIQSINLQTSYDEIFHRLIEVPPQNNYSSCGSQVPSYQPTVQSGASSIMHPNPVQFHQHNYHQMQHHQTHNQVIAQSSCVPLNYSVPLIPHSEREVEVPWISNISDTSDCLTVGYKASHHLDRRMTLNTKEEYGSSSGPTTRRTRRPNGSRIKPAHSPKNPDSLKAGVRGSMSATIPIIPDHIVRLNNSVPLIPHSEAEVEVPWIPETNNIKTRLPTVGRSKKHSQEVTEQLHFPASAVTKLKRTRRPNGSAPLKRLRNKRDPEKVRQWRKKNPLKGAVLINTTSAPVVLESTLTSEIAGTRCTYCSMLFNTVFMCQKHMKRIHESKKTYSCKVCPQVFGQKPRLIHHYWDYHRKFQPFSCPVCYKEYLHGRKFLNHLQKHPSERKSYVLGISTPKCVNDPDKFRCDVCPSAFDSYLTLINHRQEHKYICTVCGIILSDGDHLLEHTIRCHQEVRTKLNDDLYRPVENRGNTFICDKCDSEFLTQKFLAVHESRGHPLVKDSSKHLKICSIENYKCYLCDEVFSGYDLRLKHMMKIHSHDKWVPQISNCDHKKLKCELCRLTFNSILKLRCHYETRHIPNTSRRKKSTHDELAKSVDPIINENNNTTRAEVDVNIADSTIINKTMTLVNPTPPVQRNELEVAVDSIIVDQKQLTQLTASLTTEVPPTVTGLIVVYPCNLCRSKYKTEEFLEKHVNKEHQSIMNQYRFPCNICNKLFSDPSTLRRHKRTYHSTARKTFQCPHCPRMLTRAEHLRSHVKLIHGGAALDPVAQKMYDQRIHDLQKNGKPHKCDLCEARFMYKKGVVEHKRVIHGPKIATFCEICGKQIETSSPKSSLKIHLQKYHQNEADAVAAIETTPIVSFGLGSVLQRIPLSDVINLIDDLYYLDRHSGIEKPSIDNRVGRKRVRKSRRKKNASVTEREVSETEEEADSEDSDPVYLSGDSSNDSNGSETSESELDSTDDDSTVNVPDAAKRREVSIKNVVIKPKKRIQPSRVQQNECDSNLTLTVRMPSIILKRCNDLVKKMEKLSEREPNRRITKSGSRNSSKRINYASVYDSESEGSNYGEKSVTIPDVNYKCRTRPSNSSKRFNIDVHSEEEDSD